MTTQSAEPARFGSITVATTVLPGRHRATAVLRLGTTEPRRPVLWTLPGLLDLQAALGHLAGLDVEAVVLAGNEHSFGSGADLGVLASVNSRAEGERAAHLGWQSFRALAALPVPSFALITGYALGGGLELALFADYRVARSDTGGIGLPEVGLGILPGWGGAWQLGRLAGAQAAIATAVDDSMRGRTQRAAQALERGVVDAVLPAGSWERDWLVWVAERVDAGKRPEPVPVDEAAWRAVVEAAAARLRAGRPRSSQAPEVTLELIAKLPGQDLDTAEQETSLAFGDLLYSDVARASIYAQGLTRRRPVVPSALSRGRARPVDRVGILGAGLMASQLATLIAGRARVPVVLTDLDAERAARGLELVRGRLSRQVSRGALSEAAATEIADLVTATADPAGIAGADLVIEAIFEELQAKQQAFAAAERQLAPDAILATNTSSLSITAIAEPLAHPERVIGFHVFNPVEVVPLLEIIPGARTSPDAAATALDLGTRLRRSVVFSADAPGFVVNRLLTRMFDIPLQALDAGCDAADVDRSLDGLGLPMTPLQLLDFVGPAVQLHVSQTMHQAFPERFGLPVWLGRVVEAGLGTVLAEDGRLSPQAAALLPAPAEQADAAGLLTEAVEALAQEVRLMLDEGVVAEPADIDFAVLLGANWPRELGGITPALDRWGVSERVTGRRFHPRGTVTLD